MGNSQLIAVVKQSSGKLMYEDFESPTYLTDEGWSILRGAPTQSSATSHVGIFSFPMDTSYPQIGYTFAAGVCTVMTLWFYDDATQTATAFSPALQATDNLAHVYGIGVNNATSTTKYTLWENGSLVASGVTRTTGWHRLSLYFSPTNTLNLDIDGVITTLALSSASFASMSIGATNATGAVFGYFDTVQAATNVVGRFYISTATPGGAGDVSTARFLQQAAAPGSVDTQIFPGAGYATSGAFSFNQNYTVDFPLAMYALFSRPTDTQASLGGNPSYIITDLIQNVFMGDIYAIYILDLGRRWATMAPSPSVAVVQTQSNSGKIEAMFLNARDMVSVLITDLTDAQIQTTEAWWNGVKQAVGFSLVTDSSTCFWAQFSAVSTAGGANTTAVLTRTAGLSPGMQLRLRGYDRSYEEVAVIKSVNYGTNTVTFATPLVYNYLAGDVALSPNFWPRVLTTDSSLGKTLINPKVKRWNLTVNVQESI